MDRRTSDNLTTLGNVLIGLGVAVWGVYALFRWGLGWEVSVSQFLPFHLSGVIPGAMLRHWKLLGKVFK